MKKNKSSLLLFLKSGAQKHFCSGSHFCITRKVGSVLKRSDLTEINPRCTPIVKLICLIRKTLQEYQRHLTRAKISSGTIYG